MDAKIIGDVTTQLFDVAKPWIPKAAAVLVGSYGLLFVLKKFWRRMPDEVKAVVPIVLGIAAQIIYPVVFQTMSYKMAFVANLGIGFGLGAIVSSVYDIFVRRAKAALHKKAGLE